MPKPTKTLVSVQIDAFHFIAAMVGGEIYYIPPIRHKASGRPFSLLDWCGLGRNNSERPAGQVEQPVVPSKQKPPWISAVTRLLVSWAPCWSYGQIDVRKNTGRGGPNFSVRWFFSTAPGFRNWHLPVHMGILAHPRPCHRLAVPAAPHEPCTRQLVLFSNRLS